MFRRVYLDNSATTPVDPRVVEAMLPYLTEVFGNPSSIHYFGQQAKAALDKARHQVAGLIRARPNEVIFTSGGTESNNLAIRGIVETAAADGKPAHIVTSAIEHSAVTNVCESLEKSGVAVTYLPVYDNGVVRLDDLKRSITDDTVLVTVMTANNEIGTLNPVGEIGRFVAELRAKGQKVFFHTDAVQAVGKIPIDVTEMHCDLLSLSGHKIHAPKGIGALFVKRGVRLKPQNIGGHQERDRRGGTESMANIVALGEACDLAGSAMAAEASRLRALRDKLEDGILETVPHASGNGDRAMRLPNISNISFEGIEGEGLLINLDMQGVAVSTGSACSSGTLEPSPVIRALGHDDAYARSAIRFSLGRTNTVEDVERLLEVLPAAVENLRKLSAPRG